MSVDFILLSSCTFVRYIHFFSDAECHVYEEENTFKGLFFATANMKRSMVAFPEILGIDATFKLLNIRAPVYLMIVEDSEGSTEIVGVSILISEDAESVGVDDQIL